MCERAHCGPATVWLPTFFKISSFVFVELSGMFPLIMYFRKWTWGSPGYGVVNKDESS